MIEGVDWQAEGQRPRVVPQPRLGFREARHANHGVLARAAARQRGSSGARRDPLRDAREELEEPVQLGERERVDSRSTEPLVLGDTRAHVRELDVSPRGHVQEQVVVVRLYLIVHELEHASRSAEVRREAHAPGDDAPLPRFGQVRAPLLVAGLGDRLAVLVGIDEDVDAIDDRELPQRVEVTGAVEGIEPRGQVADGALVAQARTRLDHRQMDLVHPLPIVKDDSGETRAQVLVLSGAVALEEGLCAMRAVAAHARSRIRACAKRRSSLLDRR